MIGKYPAMRRNGQCRTGSRRWAAMAWLGMILMLFNLFNAATMGVRPMSGMEVNGEPMLCAAHQAGAGEHHHSPSPAHDPSDCCSCCLSMCCTGAALPEGESLAWVPHAAWMRIAYAATSDSQLPEAIHAGGNARGPPSLV